MTRMYDKLTTGGAARYVGVQAPADLEEAKTSYCRKSSTPERSDPRGMAAIGPAAEFAAGAAASR